MHACSSNELSLVETALAAIWYFWGSIDLPVISSTTSCRKRLFSCQHKHNQALIRNHNLDSHSAL